MHNAVWHRAADEFSDKGAPDIVLFNGPEPPGNQTPQPGRIARRMDIAADDARPENRQTFEADASEPLTFGNFIHAQAIGDATVLAAKGRPVLRLHLTDLTDGLNAVRDLLR